LELINLYKLAMNIRKAPSIATLHSIDCYESKPRPLSERKYGGGERGYSKWGL